MYCVSRISHPFLHLICIINPDVFKAEQDVTGLRLMLVISKFKASFPFSYFGENDVFSWQTYLLLLINIYPARFSVTLICWDLFNNNNIFLAINSTCL